jgi:predicted integral membrane protein DUF2269
MMHLRAFLLTLHVFSAIAAFGSSFAFPFIGQLAQKEGAPVKWFLELMHLIESKWLMPFALTVQPGTGAGLIIISHGTHNPFDWSKPHSSLWLFIALVLYTTAMAFSVFVQIPRVGKALKMAEANQYGPEFGALMKKGAMGGQFLTVLLVGIIILMVVKPGA